MGVNRTISKSSLYSQQRNLPVELKKSVIARLSIWDSLKLLKVNREFRNYILSDGPFWKRRFNLVQVKLSDENQGKSLEIVLDSGWPERTRVYSDFLGSEIRIDYNFSDVKQSSCIQLTLVHVDQILLNLFKDFRSCETLKVDQLASIGDDFDIERLPINFEFVKKLDISSFIGDISEMDSFARRFHPEITDEILIKFSRNFISEKDGFLNEKLKMMARDCKHIKIWNPFDGFQEVFYQSRVETVTLGFHDTTSLWIELGKIINNGIPISNQNVEFFICLLGPYDRYQFNLFWQRIAEMLSSNVSLVPIREGSSEKLMAFKRYKCYREKHRPDDGISSIWASVYRDINKEFTILFYNEAIFCFR